MKMGFSSFFRFSIFTCISALSFGSYSPASLAENRKTDKTQEQPAVSQPISSPIVVDQKVDNWDMQCIYPTTLSSSVVKSCTSHLTLSVHNKTSNSEVNIASIALVKNQKMNDIKDVAAEAFQIVAVVPLGFSLQKPVSVSLNAQNKIDLSWVACSQQGCIASQTLNEEQKKTLENNKDAQLVLPRVNNTTLTINFNLNHLNRVMNSMDKALSKKTP